MSERIIAVVGFSRCGTSLTMRMLHAGGVEVIADNHASFEDDRALELPNNPDWLRECFGKAVKILEPQHYRPPFKFNYDFIWCERNPLEQAKSQVKFLTQIGGMHLDAGAVQGMAASIVRDTPCVKEKLQSYPNSRLLTVKFEDTLSDPERTAHCLGGFIDIGKPLDFDAMIKVVVPRNPGCVRGFLEMAYL